MALAGLGLAALIVALIKTGALREATAVPWLWGAPILPLLGALVGALRPVPSLLAAKLLDRAHDLHDRVTNAVAFSAEPSRTPFMKAAIQDALTHASKLSPARAMPFHAPLELIGVAGLGIGVGVLSLLEVPRVVEERILTRGIDAVRLHDDDLEAYKSEIRELLQDPETPDDVREAAREFNRLIEDLADERLDRAESLRRLAELEQRLAQTRPGDQEMMRESLEQLGRELSRSALADELASALSDGDAQRAEAEMRRLAERLRANANDPSRAELERLRRALARAAESQPNDRSQELQRREEEMRRLLRRQREQKQESPEQRRLLQRRQRELERLRREHQEAMEQRRQLERLQREMREAAEQLNQQQSQQAANDLDQGAESLNRMARQQLSQEEMQRLQQQLSQLRELLRQQQRQAGNQGQQRQGQGQGQGRMDRFVLRARGEGGTPLVVPGQGRRGQGQQGRGQGQDGQGQGQQGQSGQAGGGRGGHDGQGGEPGQQQVLQLGGEGEGNAILELPGMSQQQRGAQGTGRAQMGPGAGTGHDPTMLDDPTRLGGNRQNVRVEGQHGEGPSRSEVIMSSAQRGFANRSYQDVYTDYSGHAEEVLERDDIPQGYRFYVRRYFQLIRPREGVEGQR